MPEAREQMDLALVESAGGGPFNPDGTVNVVIIRPCNGRGPYKNIYDADVLARDAGVFSGFPMFWNHDSAKARQERQGLPRSPADLAGVVRESFWDPTYATPGDGQVGLGRGAVIGRCALTDEMEALVRKIPEAIKLSVNAQATAKRPGVRNGRKGSIVEGFVNDPENSSVDFVTRAGAGGEVARVLEAVAMNGADGAVARVREAVSEAASDPAVQQMLAAVVLAELDAGFDGRICEAPALPERPGDGSVVDALLSPEFVARVREMARTAVAKHKFVARVREMAKHKQAIRGAATMAERQAGPQRPSLKVLEAVGAKSPRRRTASARAFLEGRQAAIDEAVLRGAGAARPSSGMAIVESLMPQRADGDPVPDPHWPGTGVREASVASVPPAQRGWRERLRSRGLSDRTIEALEEPGRDWSGEAA